MTITTEEAERLAVACGLPIIAAALRSLAAERDAVRARVAELEHLAKSLLTDRNKLIGVLQLAVEQSGETGENEPAWFGPACRILNAGFTKSAALEGKNDG
jgi:hypothetical protein